jgi:DNA-binding CsgD family transcriptional regulator
MTSTTGSGGSPTSEAREDVEVGIGDVLLDLSDIEFELTRLIRRLVAGARLLRDQGVDEEASGDVLLDREVDGFRCLLTRCRADKESRPSKLTPRELEVAQMVATGLTNSAIAGKLGVSPWTISTHVRRIFAKLDVPTRAAMVAVIADAQREWPGTAVPRQPGVDGVPADGA